jgi:hypothetical protein
MSLGFDPKSMPGGPALAESRQPRLAALFEQALKTEIAFHDAPISLETAV